jgi:hypothetical protein
VHLDGSKQAAANNIVFYHKLCDAVHDNYQTGVITNESWEAFYFIFEAELKRVNVAPYCPLQKK